MQSSRAAELRRQWAEKGSPACDHPAFSPEFILGSRTGDKICATCGEEFAPNDPVLRNREQG
jgi:hypothetical protein